MHSSQLVGSLLFLVSAVGARAQVPDELAKRIVAEGLEHSHVMAFQDTLCNEIGSRLTGSLAFDRAAEWARSEFAAMGLEAKLEPWGQWQVGWDREQWQGRMLSPEPLELQVAALAWSASTKGEVTGTLAAMPGDAAAVAALQRRLDAGEQLFLYGVLNSKADEAVRNAVQQWLDAGSVLGHLQSAQSTNWTDKQFKNQIRVFGDSHQAQKPYADRPKTPHVVIRDDQAASLEQKLAGEAPVVLQLEIRNRWRPGPVVLNNVAAELKGTDYPEEVVIVCAHLDSWHQATGATDNGTGSCSTLEAARILTAAGVKPKRTIRFLLWSGEEQGLLGSRQYVVRHRQEMHRVAAVFNHDGGTNWAQGLTVAESQAADFTGIVAPILSLMQVPQAGFTGPVFKLSTTPVLQPAGGGSDHASFGAVGVPAFGWGQTGEVQYGRGWHSQWDTYSIVVPKYQQQTATVIALVALGVANLDHLLTREGVERAQPNGQVNAQLVAETWLGLELDGLKIRVLGDAGPAQRAQMQVGDRLASVAGTKVEDAAALVAALRAAWAKAPEIQVEVERADGLHPLQLRRR